MSRGIGKSENRKEKGERGWWRVHLDLHKVPGSPVKLDLSAPCDRVEIFIELSFPLTRAGGRAGPELVVVVVVVGKS